MRMKQADGQKSQAGVNWLELATCSRVDGVDELIESPTLAGTTSDAPSRIFFGCGKGVLGVAPVELPHTETVAPSQGFAGLGLVAKVAACTS